MVKRGLGIKFKLKPQFQWTQPALESSRNFHMWKKHILLQGAIICKVVLRAVGLSQELYDLKSLLTPQRSPGGLPKFLFNLKPHSQPSLTSFYSEADYGLLCAPQFLSPRRYTNLCKAQKTQASVSKVSQYLFCPLPLVEKSCTPGWPNPIPQLVVIATWE